MAEEMRWLEENAPFLEKNHPGKWVAVVGSRLVGMGDTPEEAEAQSIAKGYRAPLTAVLRRAECQDVYLIRSPRIVRQDISPLR